MSPSCFKYSPLDKTKSQIRLLREHVTAYPLQYTLTTFHTSTCPRYIALSYVWGDDEPTKTIIINEQSFKIRDNLSLALPCLGGFSDWRDEKYFWIDAICINQKDTEERNHCVGMMKDIFTKASLTVSWLGQEKETSELLRSAADTWPEAGSRDLVEKIACNAYFRRMWIVQEVILSREIWVLCGRVECSWEKLQNHWYISGRMGTNLNMNTFAAASLASIGVAADPSLTNLSSAMFWRDAFHLSDEKVSEQLQLHHLLNSFLDRKCHDPRDRIYSLLGLLPRETLQSNPLPVNYDTSLEDLFTLVLQHMDQSSAGANPEYSGNEDVLFSRAYNARNLRIALQLDN